MSFFLSLPGLAIAGLMLIGFGLLIVLWNLCVLVFGMVSLACGSWLDRKDKE